MADGDTPAVAPIEIHELQRDRPALWDALAVIRHETDGEINPDDPPAPIEELIGDLTARTSTKYLRGWVALLDGEPAGELTFELETNDENRHLASSDGFAVRPSLRRRGVADVLLRVALDELRADDRTSLLLWAPSVGPDTGHGYAERLGLTPRTEERCSRLRMTDLDEDLVERWLAEGRGREDGYRLVQFSDRCPDENLEPYLEALAAMDDAPTDDLDWKMAPADAELVRSREDNWAQRNLVVARSLVVSPDGRGAGVSELFVSRFRPVLAHQGDTAVVAEHRGRGLGRWLKAENLRFAQTLVPAVEVVETYNAQTNPWMLDINVAMGFRPHVVWQGFQGDLAAALAVVS